MGYLSSLDPEMYTPNELNERRSVTRIDEPGHASHGQYRASVRRIGAASESGVWAYGATADEAVKNLEKVTK